MCVCLKHEWVLCDIRMFSIDTCVKYVVVWSLNLHWETNDYMIISLTVPNVQNQNEKQKNKFGINPMSSPSHATINHWVARIQSEMWKLLVSKV